MDNMTTRHIWQEIGRIERRIARNELTAHPAFALMKRLVIEALRPYERTAPRVPDGWTHSCAAILTDGVELWIDACPHCGKPRPNAAPAPAEQVTNVNGMLVTHDSEGRVSRIEPSDMPKMVATGIASFPKGIFTGCTTLADNGDSDVVQGSEMYALLLCWKDGDDNENTAAVAVSPDIEKLKARYYSECERTDNSEGRRSRKNSTRLFVLEPWPHREMSYWCAEDYQIVRMASTGAGEWLLDQTESNND